MKNRHYQNEAINSGLNHKNGIIVAPTGSGKSHIAAGLVNGFDGDTLILQPSAEILESNFSKIIATGYEGAEIYSASLNKKNIGKATYATIGSIMKCLDLFSHIKNIIIDECHLVNAKGGMYEKLIKELNPTYLIGMTATPYRLGSNSWGSAMKLLTRTRPKIFKDVIYNINPCDLEKEGYLLRPEYIECEIDSTMLGLNSTGAEFSDRSISKFMERNDPVDKFLEIACDIAKKHNHVLVFMRSVEENKRVVNELQAMGYTAAEINAKSKNRKSARLAFESGEIQFMVNVGTLTTGYDFPALDCEVDCSPTASLSLYYQKGGRVVRPYPNKKPTIYDMVGNHKRFGNPMDFKLIKDGNLFDLFSPNGKLTTRFMTIEPECETVVEFGKHQGVKLREIPKHYLEWCKENMKTSDSKKMFSSELIRRDLRV